MDERGGDERDAREAGGGTKGSGGGRARRSKIEPRAGNDRDREIAGEAADAGGREGRTLKSSRQTLMVASGERAFRRGGLRRAL
jgi:hypothetical protein